MKIKLLFLLLLIGSGLTAQNVPSYVPTNGLVGWWPFNSNANDESGNGNNGTVNGATLTSDRFGNGNSAYEFDGIDDLIEYSQQFDFLNKTINLWFKADGFLVNACYMCDTSQIILTNDNSTMSFGAYGIGLKSTFNPNKIIMGKGLSNYLDNLYYSQWYMVSISSDNDSSKFYINGQLLSVTSNSNYRSTASFLPTKLLLGGRYTGTSSQQSAGTAGTNRHYNGTIDDFGIWNRMLTQQEITDLYNASNPAPILSCTGAFLPQNLFNGLVGWWPFCGDADDESGNGNNGTVNGATLTTDRFGNTNSAYDFDGNSLIIVDDTSILNFNSAFTISVWALKTGVDQTGHLLGKRTACADCQYQFGFDLSSPSFGVGWGGGSFGQSSYLQGVIADFDTSIWINYVGLFDGLNWKLFKNGALAGSLNSPLVNPVPTDLLFGGSGTCQKFKGKLDDIGIWNRALDSSEVAQLYNTGLCTQTIAGSCDTLIFNANLTGFNPITYANQVKVYPNPASDNLVIDCGSNFTGLNGYSIQITNVLGQTVYNSPITAQVTNIQLNPPTWVNGTYVVQFINPQGTVLDTKRIIIQ
jgi:hypothetical protein